MNFGKGKLYVDGVSAGTVVDLQIPVSKPLTKILPRHHYSRDPLEILIAKENAVENRIRGCKGCVHLSFDASSEKIITACARGRKVGRKGKCSIYRESE